MSNFFSTLKQMGIEQYGISILFDNDTICINKNQKCFRYVLSMF